MRRDTCNACYQRRTHIQNVQKKENSYKLTRKRQTTQDKNGQKTSLGTTQKQTSKWQQAYKKILSPLVIREVQISTTTQPQEWL